MRQASLLTSATPRTAITSVLCALLSFPAVCICNSALAEIGVDGNIDEPEWQGAITCDDWQRTLPFARDRPRYSNELRILSTQGGLAAAFSSPEMKAKVAATGAEVASNMTPQFFDKELRAEVPRWKKFQQETKISIEQ